MPENMRPVGGSISNRSYRLLGCGALGILIPLASVFMNVNTEQGKLVVASDERNTEWEMPNGDVKTQSPHQEESPEPDFAESAPMAPLAFTTPGFGEWMKQVTAMPSQTQILAVARKLMELNPGFDGDVTHSTNEDGVVTAVEFLADTVTDISPVRALTGLSKLKCGGKHRSPEGILADLSPLQGLRLRSLNFRCTKVSSALSQLNCRVIRLEFRCICRGESSVIQNLPTRLFRRDKALVFPRWRGCRCTN